ncbi:MAG TPA: tetratricopeptide repeat protein, partial [Oceanospirillales bacterium]|nr:tetratricopeptide repeat protein [Oceanospirillales bacterium]
KMQEKITDKALYYRLGELHEKNGNKDKALEYYKKIEEGKTKYVQAQMGIARCKIEQGKFKKAQKICTQVLQNTGQNAEALFLLITSLLFQDKQKAAQAVLEKIDYSKFTDVYKKIFRLQHGLVLDNAKMFEQAFAVFTDESKVAKQEIQKNRLLSEKELKKTQKFDTKIDDDRKDPIFLIGSPSTGLNYFVDWLYKQGVIVLNDRLISVGRPDILFTAQDMKTLKKVDDDMVRIERKIYHQKVKVLTSGIEQETPTIVDCMYINPEQMILVKKFFPNAKVVLLARDTPDIWLNQKAFGDEPIDSKDWNEAKNQIISMGLNLTQIDADKWLENDKETLNQLSELFEKDLAENEVAKQDYWRKSIFPKGHWKNYQQFLGQ